MGEATKDKYESIRLDNQLCFPLYACSKEVIRQYRKPLEELNLTYTQYIVMMVLWEHGEITEGEIGQKLHLDSGTLTPLLKRLEKQGLLIRFRSKHNERKLYLKLTEEGEALKDKATGIQCKMLNFINLTDDEAVELKRLLNRALTQMENRQ